MAVDDSGGYLPCLMCDAEVPVSRSDINESIYCSYCQVGMKLKEKKKKDEDDEEFYFEEDY